MKKKLMTVLLMGVMALSSLTACGGEKKPAESTSAQSEKAEGPTSAPSGEMVSDETFAALQDNYALLVESHDTVAELYNSEEIAANPEIEEVMAQAADVIVQMGEISQDTITEEDAVVLNDSMVQLLEALSMVVDGMETAE